MYRYVFALALWLYGCFGGQAVWGTGMGEGGKGLKEELFW